MYPPTHSLHYPPELYLRLEVPLHVTLSHPHQLPHPTRPTSHPPTHFTPSLVAQLSHPPELYLRLEALPSAVPRMAS